MLLKTQTFEERNLSSEKEILAELFSLLSSVTNLKGQIARVQKVFWQLMWR